MTDAPTPPASIHRLLRQHAETVRLMGVDFVPVFQRGETRVAAYDDSTGAPDSPMSERSEAPSPATPAPTLFAVSAPGIAAASSPASPSSGAGASVRDSAESQRLLDELRARYEAAAPHAPFIKSYTNIVFGEGDPCARLMFIGEAPGEEEDRTGRPFVGRAGQLLNSMIVAMGLSRERVYIANVLKVRPPGNATPTIEESQASAPYLYEQISIIRPEVIVTLGLPATRTILGSTESMGKLRGRWSRFVSADGTETPVMPTYHPAYLLRNYTPQERAKVWSDLQMAMERLGLSAPGKNSATS